MIRKFALLATAAALMVACGGANEENMEAKAKAAQDSAAKAMEKVAADLKAATDSAAAAAAAAAATVDTAAAKMEAAGDKMTGH